MEAFIADKKFSSKLEKELNKLPNDANIESTVFEESINFSNLESSIAPSQSQDLQGNMSFKEQQLLRL